MMISVDRVNQFVGILFYTRAISIPILKNINANKINIK